MKGRKITLGQIGTAEPVALAVEELARYLTRMESSLEVKVLFWEAVDPERKDILWVGRDPVFAPLLPEVEEPALDDGILVSMKNGSGCITGTNERSVLLAAYRLLKALGCRWVRPGAEGERIPEGIPEDVDVHIRETPSCRHRGVCLEGANSYENVAEIIDYLPKLGMNTYYIQFLLPSHFFRTWGAEPGGLTNEEVAQVTLRLEAEIRRRGLVYHKVGHGWTCGPFGFEANGWNKVKEKTVIPQETRQYLAQVNGKRQLWNDIPMNTNLCYSNPEVRRKMVEAMTAYCLENPYVDVLHFWLADDSCNHCECEVCSQKRPSDWYVAILNDLDERLTAAGVTTRIVFLIYLDLFWEPLEERIQNPDRFILMLAPINRVYGADFKDHLEYRKELPAFERNRVHAPTDLDQNLEHLRRWQAQFPGDSFDFDYHLMWAHLADPGYERCARNLFNDVQTLPAMGLNGMVSCQVQRCFFPTGLPVYAMAAGLWDSCCDFDAVAMEYYTAAFGEKAVAVREYLSDISKRMRLYVAPNSGRIGTAADWCDDYAALRRLAEEFLPTARQEAQRNGPCGESWETLRHHGEYLLRLADCFAAKAGGDEAALKAAMDAFKAYVKDNELALQKVLDADNALNVLSGHLV